MATEIERERDAYLANLTATQARCTELLTEVRGLRATLASLGPVGELGEDERRVIALLARRLLDGQRQYGLLDLARDARDFRRERGEEIADLLVYTAFAELKASTAK